MRLDRTTNKAPYIPTQEQKELLEIVSTSKALSQAPHVQVSCTNPEQQSKQTLPPPQQEEQLMQAQTCHNIQSDNHEPSSPAPSLPTKGSQDSQDSQDSDLTEVVNQFFIKNKIP